MELPICFHWNRTFLSKFHPLLPSTLVRADTQSAGVGIDNKETGEVARSSRIENAKAFPCG